MLGGIRNPRPVQPAFRRHRAQRCERHEHSAFALEATKKTCTTLLTTVGVGVIWRSVPAWIKN